MRKINRVILFERNIFFLFQKFFDWLAYKIFYKSYYKKVFKFYGNGIKWGKNSEWFLIPRSVRISCPEKIHIGHNCTFDENIYLQAHHHSEGLIIGDGTRVNAFTHIQAYSLISIGKNCLIAPFCHINSGNHSFKDAEIPIMFQGYEKSGQIILGNGVWMGRNSTILGGLELGVNCVIADSAVVTKSFPRNSTLAGVPAKKI